MNHAFTSSSGEHVLSLLDLKTVDDFEAESDDFFESSEAPTTVVSSSERLLELLSSLSVLEVQILEKEGEIKQLKNKLDYADVFYRSRLDEKLEKVKEIKNHMTTLLKAKGTLLTRLRAPMASSSQSIYIEPEYQSELRELFEWMAKTIEGINKYISILQWTNSFTYETFSMDAEVFDDLSGVLAQYQRHAECLLAMNSCLQELRSLSFSSSSSSSSS